MILNKLYHVKTKCNKSNIFIILAIILLSLLFLMELTHVAKNQLNYAFNRTIFDVDYVEDSRNEDEAPEISLGIWYGTGDPTQQNYYICHDYTQLGKMVLRAELGDNFTIKNSNFKIYDIIFVEKNAKLMDVSDKALPNNRSVSSVQVCVPGTDWNKIVIGELQ